MLIKKLLRLKPYARHEFCTQLATVSLSAWFGELI